MHGSGSLVLSGIPVGLPEIPDSLSSLPVGLLDIPFSLSGSPVGPLDIPFSGMSVGLLDIPFSLSGIPEGGVPVGLSPSMPDGRVKGMPDGLRLLSSQVRDCLRNKYMNIFF